MALQPYGESVCAPLLRRDAERARLVATLGSKSAMKKVTRKAILEVNVPKACKTIIAPEAPLALRLQGNLLLVAWHPSL